ncbi:MULTISPECIES: cytochrome d ubiquinol oxidase subunit II [unclassified Rhizobium]|uniref:cytochrome d ubiquinol oxidase subunit II n=1 Tax=unclassified Rhizobium TaxID=2613769 RepID=UPI001A98FA75|nr:MULTISPECIES: cytochrome d ubiquinol oxidase subunit II [unclassified Rhizobium]MBX5159126.1 cytochrome d ubiquinol oxidase subunit II [Rhizobium sp. NZLR8]MBX5162119.1 cytochrome d ubiquinol oxidase subunit II [Rhizobium sp. NZLR4b]MBX5171008.1 cytochrome d ubiquinol oxidase subunit II [Rhizobium sp. NZLR1b]MBX5181272.1 cytochrome d ubiquinol oxidase subunit II [Rhizobium sp. NZLR5]MBX5188177.1 cytochrome d ubiquinol oxidase subunit II [Rhizobium sp. NZLR3b]
MILHELLDYDTLRLIWWVLLGVLLIAFATTGGFDLGVGTLLPFVARTDTERRVAINTIGATWEGNQVWLILAGGAIFAAWPPLYAVSFSGFYLAMFAILFALILRPVGFKYRSKRESANWRTGWDWALFIGGFVPSLIFGVAVGNVLQGVPFRFADDMRIFYEGSFFALLNPYALLCGLLSLAMLTMHGAAWLVLKASGPVAERARGYGSIAALAAIVLFALGGLFLWIGVGGYRITSDISTIGPSNPLLKTVSLEKGAWLANYSAHSWMIAAPVLGFAGAALAFIAMRARREVMTLLFSKVAIFGIISTVGLSMFPFILPSSLDPRSSLTVWDASSSHMTLFIMLVVSAIFLPIIFAYTAWVYKVLWGKVDEKSVTDKNSHAY